MKSSDRVSEIKKTDTRFYKTENFSKQLDKIIEGLTDKPRLLLLSCCAPCSSYVLTYLKEHFDVTVLYFNPNVYPEREYQKRLTEQKRLCDIFGVPLISPAYDESVFLNAAAGLENEPEGGARCEACFRLRLSETARAAREGGFPYFATTLTVSPHKNAELINAIGKTLSGEGSVYLPSDFKKKDGYLISIRLSERYSLYRQNYCGCRFSKSEAE